MVKKVIEHDPRWQRLSDSTAAGEFFYGVITTGIYCRPGCPSRRPNPDNVRYFDTTQAAEAAGFRPCKRCHPLRVNAQAIEIERVTALCRYIEQATHTPNLTELAEYSGWSSYHLQRTFKKVTGVSPKIYARNIQQQQESHVSTPRKKQKCIHYTIHPCSLGYILIAWSTKGVCAILLDDDPDFLRKDLSRRFATLDILDGDEQPRETIEHLLNLVEGSPQQVDLPLDIQGTLFQQRVWEALQQIPPGETRSYSDIATSIGSPGAVRAVAGACAANAIALVIPCHRVVRQDGSLSGYRWGIARKRELLEREKKSMQQVTQGNIR